MIKFPTRNVHVYIVCFKFALLLLHVVQSKTITMRAQYGTYTDKNVAQDKKVRAASFGAGGGQ